MSLQIRRGTDTQRQAIVFDPGEITWASDTNKLYVGDGVTAGGVNVIATAAGTGLTWNPTNQTLNFSGTGLGLTTSVVGEGTNLYFTATRAQAAAAAMFTAVGSPVVTGTVTGTTAPNVIIVSNSSGLVVLEPFVVTGTGGGGLAAGTYYVHSIVDSTHIKLSSTLANAQAGVAMSTFTTASLASTNFSAGGGDSNITFTYNAVNNTMNVNSAATGLTAISQDTAPTLGGNLSLGGYTINGSGTINTTGNLTVSGTITASTGLGADLILNSHNVTGTGNITVSGILTSSAPASSPLAVFNGLCYPNASWISLNMSRGTTAVPTVVQPNDPLSGVIVYAYDGTSYTQSTAFGALVDTNGTISTGVVPGAFVVLTQSGAAGATAGQRQQLKFNSLGVLSVPSLTATNITRTGLSIIPANYLNVSSTGTYALSTIVSDNILIVSGTGYTATLTFPSTGLVDGQQLKFTVTTNTVTLALTAGPTLVGIFAGSVTAPTTFTYTYRVSNTTWYKV